KPRAETFVAMPARTSAISHLGQQVAHAAVGMNVMRIEPQRDLEMLPGLVQFTGEKQQGREIDMPHRVAGMMPHRLAEQGPGGVLVTGLEHERAEVVQGS